MIKETTNNKTRAKASEFLVLIEKRRELRKQLYECDNAMWETLKEVRPAFAKGSKEYALLKNRFIEHLSLEDTAKLYGVTRERIRQIEEKVLDHLKSISF